VGSSFRLVRHRVRDVGTQDFTDVAVFPPVDRAEEFGEGKIVGEVHDAVELLDQAALQGAQPDRWVNQSVVQDEYQEARRERQAGP
jgi:hypothetical protein